MALSAQRATGGKFGQGSHPGCALQGFVTILWWWKGQQLLILERFQGKITKFLSGAPAKQRPAGCDP